MNHTFYTWDLLQISHVCAITWKPWRTHKMSSMNTNYVYLTLVDSLKAYTIHCGGMHSSVFFSPVNAGMPAIPPYSTTRKRRKRYRTIFTETQIALLEELYRTTPYPDLYQRESVAFQAGLQEERVEVGLWRTKILRYHKHIMHGKLSLRFCARCFCVNWDNRSAKRLKIKQPPVFVEAELPHNDDCSSLYASRKAV